MAIMPAAGVEPIPGYKLIEKLGVGGYGEVWKVTAPGGLTKALKIVFGDLSGPRAEQELKSLERIKSVRHPFLISLERYEILDDQLMIVTELAERSLQDRFLECCAGGLKGIPHDELVGYLRDAADALDFMHETHGLQHLDIKPQNLLLIGGRIKVADFGLVKEMAGQSGSITGGVTPLYAPPEAFDGRMSRHSDQYSLAIVYQEMLTGVRPFPGTTAYQLAAQHTSSPPLLDSLPVVERRCVARALSKLPEQRFPSCREMVNSLVAAQKPPESKPTVSVESKDFLAGDRAALLAQDTLLGIDPETERNRVRALEQADSARQQEAAEVPTELKPQLQAEGEEKLELGGSASFGLRPTIFIGLGGFGGRVLQLLQHRLEQSSLELDAVPIFQFLAIDTDRADLRQLERPDTRPLAGQALLHCPLHPPEHYRDRQRGLLRWMSRPLLFNIPRSFQTEGLRPLGRLALMDQGLASVEAIRQALTRATDPSALAAAVGVTGRALRTETPRVFVISSLMGGTGSGMLIDIAFILRHLLKEENQSTDGLCGMLVLAGTPRPDDQARARINAYATLQELHHWGKGDMAHPGAAELGLPASLPGQAPFSDCYLLHQPDNSLSLEAVAGILAEYLCFDSTLGGGDLDRLRLLSTQTSRSDVEQGPLGPDLVGPAARRRATYRSFGLTRIAFPRERLLEFTAQLICRRMVERWPGEASLNDRDQMEQEASHLVQQRAINDESIRSLMHESLPGLLGDEPEVAFRRLVSHPLERVASQNPTRVNPFADPLSWPRLLGAFDDRLGIGPDPNSTTPLRPTEAEATFKDYAQRLGRDLSRAISDWLLEKIEQPGQRLRSAELAQAWIKQYLMQESEKTQKSLNELRMARQSLRRRLLGTGDANPGKGSEPRWRGPWRMRSVSAPDEERFWLYYCLRIEEIIAENTLGTLGVIQGRMSLFNQELTLARQRLSELIATFPAHIPQFSPRSPTPTHLRELFPYGAENLPAAVTALLSRMPLEMLRQLDRVFQSEVLDAGGGLWAMLSGNVDASRLKTSRLPESIAFWNMVSRNAGIAEGVRENLMTRARALVLSQLRGVDVASLFLDWHGGVDRAGESLEAQVSAAQPLSIVQSPWQHLMLVIPEGSSGSVLREFAMEILQGRAISVLEGPPVILIAHEAAWLSLRDLAQRLAEQDPSVPELASKIVTRTDIPWSYFAS